MSRRERTTALPRTHLREQSHRTERTFLGRSWSEGDQRKLILGGAALLLLIVIAAFAWRLYYNQVARPNKVIAEVGAEKIRLDYYTDRLFEFARANSNTSLPLIQSGLLTKLEEEALTVQEAEARGIVLDDNAVTQAIADKLGVPVGGDGSSFDIRYRAELARTGLTDSSFRRLSKAELADTKLRDMIGSEVGDTGEMLTMRIVVSPTEDAAKAIYDRIMKGENMGTIAQTESTDLSSRANDGVRDPEPREILEPTIRTAVEGKQVGDVVGPLLVNGSWVVLRVEVIDPARAYTPSQKDQVIEERFAAMIAARRAQVEIKRDFTADDAQWATTHTNGDTSAVVSGTQTP